jgi:hypothetical protein
MDSVVTNTSSNNARTCPLWVNSGQLFRPFERELRREIQKLDLSNPPASDDAYIPASDRVVTLDHNSKTYRDLIDILERIEIELAARNDHPDPALKERQVAEISAGRRMLRAAKVRAVAIYSVLSTPLIWIAKHFADKELGHLADQAWTWLTSLIP